jgi:hypothetical protein
MSIFAARYRLTEKPDSAGLSCDEGGLTLAGVHLLRRTAVGFEPRSVYEIDLNSGRL